MTNAMKRRLALALRRLAHRVDPDPVESIDVHWSGNDLPHMDIQFRHGQRVVGYVGAGH